ncbi:CAP domain-containing protein [Palleronia caenipelagi]|uniref:CAP domain-containing protein n=1 Tax=Palleronia caenipelagi TaxID=2489174 RepID=A0A547Q6G5_9RHOB|nr:CAP domain-containing protein [Palleronia caenipelagi]TRD21977.1 CAP domain-containing protein [Palleronia caenipelagi]
MIRATLTMTALSLALVACAAPPAPPLVDGKPLPQKYDMASEGRDVIQLRFLDGMNALRQAAGVGPVALDVQLNAAAATHSRDMSVQNRPWHFGSDGSSPIDRARRTGYYGRVLGENISETYETELETLAAWMEDPNTRAVITDPNAQDLGFAWYQQPTGKIWWTMVTGRR